MFISSEYDNKSNSLILVRKSRKDSNVNSYLVHRLIIDNPVDKYSYETERSNFIGIGHDSTEPVCINNKLSNYTGDNLDPVCSIRNKIIIDAGSSKSVYVVLGFGRSREQINDIINSYITKYDFALIVVLGNTHLTLLFSSPRP